MRKFTQKSKELEALKTAKGEGILLSNSLDGEVTQSYHYQGGRGTEKAPLSPYVGKLFTKAARRG